MMMNSRRLQLVRPSVTLEEVSTAAGVSKSTASRALCNEPNVKAETRARVRAIAEGLGYVPNEAARALAARRQVVVAVTRAG
jgi:DNA-binding LacI/PurR family transcriptional regulator